MALVTYPSLRQCEGSNREEITNILSDVSQSGVIRGRVSYVSPTYRLRLAHTALTRAEFDTWETFWNANFTNEMQVTWVGDGNDYRGIPGSPPVVSARRSNTYDVTTELICKRV